MAVRRQAGTEFSEAAPFDERAYEWLSSHEAEVWAKKLLKQHRLPIDPKDLTSDAMRKIYLRFQEDPALLEEEKWKRGIAKHYCIKVMRNLLLDVLRARKRTGFGRREDEFELSTEDEYEIDGVISDGSGLGDDLGGGKFIDRLRVVIELSGAKTWAISAALANLTLAAFPDADTGSAPLPLAGAKPAHARLWPSLWFAGQRDLFDISGDNSQTALRKKRTRRMKEVSDLVKTAGAQLGIEDRS